ncbi:uncharacterized protein ACLA_007830 [Aspergillus clavatus NRRL 1]|uniref:Uncharacterized protein n=1 Tax=Aspergillus clavatus (strain ATCC 1007 / CBS 513.65 / DSM 816 / NCTC 3887 / NRRL 1 / QM 1276 / 107) TaxID=344612 RepID=A1CDU6_ASPCL|nr:uncharacterized protein ACLA_007830 [Aspergillus clavatus NRRL 1]EAW12023.1 conserved hypothetical protein [Aspergillus clavatus NRRL 1]
MSTRPSKTKFPSNLYTTVLPTFTPDGDMTPETHTLATNLPPSLYTPSLRQKISNIALHSDRLAVCLVWTEILGTYFGFAPPTVQVRASQRYFVQLDLRSPLPWIPGYIGLMPQRGTEMTGIHFLQMRCCAPPVVGQGPDWLGLEEMMAGELAEEYGEEVERDGRMIHGILTVGCYVRFYQVGRPGFMNALIEGRETLHLVEDHGLMVQHLREIRKDW